MLACSSRAPMSQQTCLPMSHRIQELAIPGGWTERSVVLGTQPFRLLVPAAPNAFLDELDAVDERSLPKMRSDPNWANLWSAARPLAESVLAARWPADARVLELGCGIGLCGLAARAAGCRVTFSDYVPEAVALALENARRNGFDDRVEGLILDWRVPLGQRFEWIVASDVLYDNSLHEPLAEALDAMLARDGEVWIGDPGRSAAADFVNVILARGFDIGIFDAASRPRPAPQQAGFQQFRLTRKLATELARERAT